MKISKRAVIVVAIAVAMFAGIVVLSIGIASASVPPPTPEQQYLQEVRSAIVDADEATDRDLLYVGVSACRALASGIGEDELIAIGPKHGLTIREIKAIIGTAKQYLCDE